MRTVQIATYWNLGQGHISPLQWVASVRPYSMSARLLDKEKPRPVRGPPGHYYFLRISCT